MINYASVQKAPNRYPAGRFDVQVQILVPDSKDAYGQVNERVLLTTRCNINVLMSDDQTNLERVTACTVYTRALEPLLKLQPSQAFLRIDVLDNEVFIDIADVLAYGVYATITGKQVIR